jgi:hypothetical protein
MAGITSLSPPQGVDLHYDGHLFTARSRQTAARIKAIVLGSTLIYPLYLNNAERLAH